MQALGRYIRQYSYIPAALQLLLEIQNGLHNQVHQTKVDTSKLSAISRSGNQECKNTCSRDPQQYIDCQVTPQAELEEGTNERDQNQGC